ncbi:MAG: serine hydrolase [Woeseiaceae bacterium]|nr:serine hydrolase [Woeseiaceae bacterium]
MRKLAVYAVLLGFAVVAVADTGWQPLYNRVDTDLQKRLEERLNANPEWKRLIARRKMAIGLVDLSGDVPRFARVNGNHMMYAASLPKIAILVAAYASFEDGSLEETDEVRQDLGDMIRVSSNSAATRMIDRIGMKKIQSVLRDPKFGLYDEKRGGGLWVGKRYASSGVRVGDPMHNISHGATATQVCRFFYLLSEGRLINSKRSRQMLADLSDPRLHHKFVSQVEERAPNARMFRKSGTWRQWHSDAILVRGTLWRDYILVGLVESENGETILRRVLPAVEELIVPDEYSEGIGTVAMLRNPG